MGGLFCFGPVLPTLKAHSPRRFSSQLSIEMFRWAVAKQKKAEGKGRERKVEGTDFLGKSLEGWRFFH